MELLSLKEAADVLLVSTRTVRRLLDARKLSYYKIGGLIKIDKKDIDVYLASTRVEAKVKEPDCPEEDACEDNTSNVRACKQAIISKFNFDKAIGMLFGKHSNKE